MTRVDDVRNVEVRPESTGGAAEENPLMKRADRFLLIGIVLGGTWAFGVFSIPFLWIAYRLMSQAQREGRLTRPWAVTIIGTFCLIDASVNFIGWGTDLFMAHDTTLMRTLWPGYGKLVDGAYYIDYNSLAVGGLANLSEKVLQFYGVLVMYPMRMAAAWAFVKMKRWGLQAMVITSFMYVGFWVAYVANLYLAFNARMGASSWGVTGWWIMVIIYASPFVVLPYLYTVNRDLFSD